jgi:hypothetical protein
MPRQRMVLEGIRSGLFVISDYVREETALRLPDLIGEPSERGDLKTDQHKRETMG